MSVIEHWMQSHLIPNISDQLRFVTSSGKAFDMCVQITL